MILDSFFKKYPKTALAFSGGADSAYLLYVGLKAGWDIQPYFVKSPFQPQKELADALAFCKKITSQLSIISHNSLEDSEIRLNTPKRCYNCKKSIFTLIKQQAQSDGYSIIIDGTNASDRESERPGMKALVELGVLSPLKEYNLTKDKIRELSRKENLITWNKPSYSCLATRISTGEEITKELLTKAEEAENILTDLGFNDFRVRIAGNTLRIQLKEKEWLKGVKKRLDILTAIKPIFSIVSLDLEMR